MDDDTLCWDIRSAMTPFSPVKKPKLPSAPQSPSWFGRAHVAEGPFPRTTLRWTACEARGGRAARTKGPAGLRLQLAALVAEALAPQVPRATRPKRPAAFRFQLAVPWAEVVSPKVLVAETSLPLVGTTSVVLAETSAVALPLTAVVAAPPVLNAMVRSDAQVLHAMVASEAWRYAEVPRPAPPLLAAHAEAEAPSALWERGRGWRTLQAVPRACSCGVYHRSSGQPPCGGECASSAMVPQLDPGANCWPGRTLEANPPEPSANIARLSRPRGSCNHANAARCAAPASPC